LTNKLSVGGVGAGVDAFGAVGVVVEGLGEGAATVGDGVSASEVIGVAVVGAGSGAIAFDGGEEGITGPDVLGASCANQFVILRGVRCSGGARAFRDARCGVVVEVEGGGAGGGVYGGEAVPVVPGVGL